MAGFELNEGEMLNLDFLNSTGKRLISKERRQKEKREEIFETNKNAAEDQSDAHPHTQAICWDVLHKCNKPRKRSHETRWQM